MVINGKHYGLTPEDLANRRKFVNASDMNVVMGADDARRIERWREWRDNVTHDFFDEGVFTPALGSYTEAFNRAWYERHNGYEVFAVGERLEGTTPAGTPVGATLDGKVLIGGVQYIWEAKNAVGFKPIEDVAQSYMPQLHMQMHLAGLDRAVLSVIQGAVKHETITVHMDADYMALVLQWADWWWAALHSDVPPEPVNVPAAPWVSRSVEYDMTGDNMWADAAAVYTDTLAAANANKQADKQLKAMVPDDATSASGHGVTVKVSKNGSKRIGVEK